MIRKVSSRHDHYVEVATARAYAQLGRPQNIPYPALLAAGSVLLLRGPLLSALLCIFFYYCMYPIAAAYNNIHDQETDSINKRTDNPLTTGALGTNNAYRYIFVHIFLLLIVELYLRQPAGLVIFFGYLILMYCYSRPGIAIQGMGYLGIGLLAICYGSLPIVLAVTQTHTGFSTPLLVLIALQAMTITPLLLAKDYKDIKGDRQTGKTTPLVRYGTKHIKQTAVTISAICAVLWLAFGMISGSLRIVAVLFLMGILYFLLVERLHTTLGQPSSASAYVLRGVMLCMPFLGISTVSS